MNNHFKDKVVWITGASSGIGEALAEQFAKHGAKIVLSARRENVLKSVQEKVGLNDKNSLIIPLDVTDYSSATSATQQVIEKFGKIDILVNNAGISQRAVALDTHFEVYQRLMNVNFFGAISITKEVLPFMAKAKSGHIVTISSVAGKIGVPLRTGYCASKHALHGFYDSLRTEVYDKNIKVLMVCPGYIQTNISKNALTGDGKAHNKMDDGQSNGIPVDVCAKRIVSAIASNKKEIIIANKEKYAVLIKRFVPSLYRYIIRKSRVT